VVMVVSGGADPFHLSAGSSLAYPESAKPDCRPSRTISERGGSTQSRCSLPSIAKPARAPYPLFCAVPRRVDSGVSEP
jgi:hypothetical protein